MRLFTILFLLSLLLMNCGKDDDGHEVIMPSGLNFTIDVAPDGSGNVEVSATAENTNFYNISFGENDNEIVRSTNGKAAYTYSASGVYTITVTAHVTDDHFISSTKDVTISLLNSSTIVWQDEFDGTSLSSDTWTAELGGGGWGNNELQYYRAENATVSGGFLTITAKKENFGGRNYTSSRLITKGKKEFKYGRVDIRAKLPKGQGIWPALWMLGANISSVGWPKCGEIDIMEMVGGNNRERTIHGTLHWDENGHECTCGEPGYTKPSGTFSDDFHVYSVVWDETNIKWYVDDILFNTINITPAALQEFHENYFVILNVAVGGNWPGSPDNTTTFPQELVVDYVRVSR